MPKKIKYDQQEIFTEDDRKQLQMLKRKYYRCNEHLRVKLNNYKKKKYAECKQNQENQEKISPSLENFLIK